MNDLISNALVIASQFVPAIGFLMGLALGIQLLRRITGLMSGALRSEPDDRPALPATQLTDECWPESYAALRRSLGEQADELERTLRQRDALAKKLADKEKHKCAYCGTRTKPEWHKCPSCGAPL